MMQKTPNSTNILVSHVLKVLSALSALSSLLINPWIGAYYRDPIINYQDVMLLYFQCSLSISILLAIYGYILKKVHNEYATNVGLLLGSITFLLLVDRALLVYTGLPYWIPDSQIHYKHRPNTTRMWWRDNPTTNKRESLKDKLLIINEHGYHDDSFPVEKPSGEFRAVFIGDSITMGHGVTRDETFSNQLEDILQQFGKGYDSYQIINTGVQGYSAHQELQALREAMRFSPDFIAVGFCPNDVTEPYWVDKRLGGTGWYYAMSQTSGILTGYLLNETGFGRAVQRIRETHFKSEAVRAQYKNYDVRAMAELPLDNDKFQAGWELQLKSLESIYALAAQHNVPIVLLTFPYTFQLFHDKYDHPQLILSNHAQNLGIPYIDFTDYFEDILETDRIRFSENYERNIGIERMDFYGVQKDKFFLDANHLKPMGHKAIAVRLAEHLQKQNLIEIDVSSLYTNWQSISSGADDFELQVPHDFRSTQRIAHFLKVRGDYKAMEQLYERVASRFKDQVKRAYFLLVLGDIYAEQGQLKIAIETYRKGLDLAPNLVDLHSSLAMALLQVGDQGNALYVFLHAIEMGSKDANTYIQLASLFANEGRIEEALNVYEALLINDISNATADQFFMAGIKLQDRINSANKAYYKALEINPHHTAARVNLGWNLVLLGEFDEAIRENLTVLRGEANSTAHFNLGFTYLLQGKTAEADSIYAVAVSQFGAEEARRIGAVDDLRNYAIRNPLARDGQYILRKYWP